MQFIIISEPVTVTLTISGFERLIICIAVFHLWISNHISKHTTTVGACNIDSLNAVIAKAETQGIIIEVIEFKQILIASANTAMTFWVISRLSNH